MNADNFVGAIGQSPLQSSDNKHLDGSNAPFDRAIFPIESKKSTYFMNTQLVDSLVQVILSLSQEERILLEKKLFFDGSEFLTRELMQLAQTGNSFEFLQDEPDIYSIQDGEPV